MELPNIHDKRRAFATKDEASYKDKVLLKLHEIRNLEKKQLDANNPMSFNASNSTSEYLTITKQMSLSRRHVQFASLIDIQNLPIVLASAPTVNKKLKARNSCENNCLQMQHPQQQHPQQQQQQRSSLVLQKDKKTLKCQKSVQFSSTIILTTYSNETIEKVPKSCVKTLN